MVSLEAEVMHTARLESRLEEKNLVKNQNTWKNKILQLVLIEIFSNSFHDFAEQYKTILTNETG